jgi:hypothetical protein
MGPPPALRLPGGSDAAGTIGRAGSASGRLRPILQGLLFLLVFHLFFSFLLLSDAPPVPYHSTHSSPDTLMQLEELNSIVDHMHAREDIHRKTIRVSTALLKKQGKEPVFLFFSARGRSHSRSPSTRSLYSLLMAFSP